MRAPAPVSYTHLPLQSLQRLRMPFAFDVDVDVEQLPARADLIAGRSGCAAGGQCRRTVDFTDRQQRLDARGIEFLSLIHI